MACKCEEYNHVCVMSLEGDFIGPEIATAQKEFEHRIETRQIVNFVVDFTKSSIIDSQGLELLLLIKHRSEELFGQVKLAGLDENMKKILEITRLQHRFECHPDVTSAMRNMR
jgi:anti-anti-sigma factor